MFRPIPSQRVLTVTMLFVSVVATTAPLHGADTLPLAASTALAWRAGLWLFMFSAVSGFAMGGRLRHSVGGDDREPGRRIVDWNKTHGDLRAPHFFAMHALQVIPAVGLALAWLPVAEQTRTAVVAGSSLGYAAVCVATFVLSVRGRPLSWRRVAR